MTKLKMFLPFGMSLKKGQTLEARFARTMDRFKPLLKMHQTTAVPGWSLM